MKLSFILPIIFCLIGVVLGCKEKQIKQDRQTYLRFVGDIESDSTLDDPTFKTCNGNENAFQYFNTGEGLRYKGEKTALVSRIFDSYRPVENSENQSGYFRVRFLVNCKGETGRFRILSSDFDYQDKSFDEAITKQLLSIVKSLDGWQIMTKNEKPLDYYQYLIFKLENGRIIEILP